MRMKRMACLSIFAAVVAFVIAGAAAEAAATSAESSIQAAAKQDRYVFVTFYKSNDSASKAMLAEVESIKQKLANRASFVSVDVGDKANRVLVSRYHVDRSPIPVMIVVAPNGAITAGFAMQIKRTDFSDVFVSNGMAAVLKAVQNGRIAVACLQNSKTKQNKESLATAESLNYQAQFSGMVEVVKIDPSDSSEAKFMQQCKVNTSSATAQLLVIVPPGRIAGVFDPTATTDSIAAAVVKSMSACSCGPGGCK